MDFGSSAATTWIGPTIARTAGTPCRWETATPRAPETVSERSRKRPTKRSAFASSARPPLPTANSIATAAARRRLKRRPPSSIIDGPTHWGVGPWWNWQHVWLWTRRFQVRVLAGQSGQKHPAEGWPSGLRRRPAKALTRKSLVGSNPTPSASKGRCGRLGRVSWVRTERPQGASSASEVSQPHPLRLPTSGLTPEASGRVAERTKAHAWRACGQQPCLVGSNPTPSVKAVSTRQDEHACPARVRTERPKGASSASPAQREEANPTPSVKAVSTRQDEHACPARVRTERPKGASSASPAQREEANPTPSVKAVSTRQDEHACPARVRTERPKGASSASPAQREEANPTPSVAARRLRKFDSRSSRGAPSPAARTGRVSSFRPRPGSRHPERWQNGNAPVSKTGALTGLGVRIPPSPLRGSNRASAGSELGDRRAAAGSQPSERRERARRPKGANPPGTHGRRARRGREAYPTSAWALQRSNTCPRASSRTEMLSPAVRSVGVVGPNSVPFDR